MDKEDDDMQTTSKKTTRKKARSKAHTMQPVREPLPNLTDRQLEILVFIHESIEADSIRRMPTMRNIAIRFGCSRQAAWAHVEALKEKGCIVDTTTWYLSPQLTELGRRVIGEWLASR